MEAVFTEHVREAKAAGTSVLLSSHILSEVEKVCDTVTIIRNGRAVESGTLADLRHLTRSGVTAVVDGDAAAIAAMEGVHDLRSTPDDVGTRVTFTVDSTEMGRVLPAIGALGVHSFTAAPPSLEELFMRHYGDPIDGDDLSARGAGARTAAPSSSGGAR